MPAIEIRVKPDATIDADQLFHIVRDLFPGENLIQYEAGEYVLELGAVRSKFILDQLENIPELQGFVPYVEWETKHRDQFPLRFGSAAEVDDEFESSANAA